MKLQHSVKVLRNGTTFEFLLVCSYGPVTAVHVPAEAGL